MQEFIPFEGAFNWTLDIIKAKLKPLALAVGLMFCAAVWYTSVLRPEFLRYVWFFDWILPPVTWILDWIMTSYIFALFFGFLFIVYIVESYLNGQKESLKGALKYCAARVKNYLFLTGFFIVIVLLSSFLAAFIPRILLFFVFIILFKYVYAYFALAFFNYDAAGALKSSAQLTKGFCYEIFKRPLALTVFGYITILTAHCITSFIGRYVSLFFSLFAVVFFVIHHSVMFLSLFNLKQNFNEIQNPRSNV
jgi:hypothetical protein